MFLFNLPFPVRWTTLYFLVSTGKALYTAWFKSCAPVEPPTKSTVGRKGERLDISYAFCGWGKNSSLFIGEPVKTPVIKNFILLSKGGQNVVQQYYIILFARPSVKSDA